MWQWSCVSCLAATYLQNYRTVHNVVKVAINQPDKLITGQHSVINSVTRIMIEIGDPCETSEIH